MSKDEAIKLALSKRGFWYKYRMLKNIDNGLGIGMMERVMNDAYGLYSWSKHYSRNWDKVTND